MKIRQNARHWATKKALELPVVGGYTHKKLVSLHIRIFLGRADSAHEDERREHLEDLFDATVDTYLAGLQDGLSEAEAREITHVQANFDFYNHGWTEMMGFPADEIEPHYDRHRDFFEKYDITVEDPLGAFYPSGGIADAPSTPEKLDTPEHPHAEGGFADDVYVETDDGDVVVGGRDEPEEVDTADAPGV